MEEGPSGLPSSDFCRMSFPTKTMGFRSVDMAELDVSLMFPFNGWLFSKFAKTVFCLLLVLWVLLTAVFFFQRFYQHRTGLPSTEKICTILIMGT